MSLEIIHAILSRTHFFHKRKLRVRWLHKSDSILWLPFPTLCWFSFISSGTYSLLVFEGHMLKVLISLFLTAVLHRLKHHVPGTHTSHVLVKSPETWSHKLESAESSAAQKPNEVHLHLPGSVVKNSPAKQETQVWFLGWEEPMGKEMATHSSILFFYISLFYFIFFICFY